MSVQHNNQGDSPTSPASFCEWTRYGANSFRRRCTKSGELFSPENYIAWDGDPCPMCEKPIKLMADALSRENEGGRVFHADTTSAATTVDDILRNWWLCSNNENLKQKLLEAGYKVLSREPTEEMVDAVTLSPASRILIKQDWRKLWDAAK